MMKTLNQFYSYKVASVKADKRIKLAISLVAMGDIGIHTIQLLKKGEQRYRPEEHHNTKSLGAVANVGLGYRILSKHEHAYVGVNTFYDHSFSKK